MVTRGILTLVFSFLLVAPSPAAPRVQTERQDHDFGTVLQGGKIEHTFRFRNLGDETLIVSQVRSSCGCTAALLSATEIPPGQSGEIRTTFDSSRFRGQVQKEVFLYSNDPAQGKLAFHLRGTVRPNLEAVPENLELGSLSPGERKEARITLTNHSEETILLTGVRATSPALQARLSASRVPPREAVEVLVQAELPPGQRQVSGYLLVQTNQRARPELRIPVRSVPGQ